MQRYLTNCSVLLAIALTGCGDGAPSTDSPADIGESNGDESVDPGADLPVGQPDSRGDGGPLPIMAGPEIIYGFLDDGTLEYADDMLEDVWYTASRFESVHLPAPLTWTEDPYEEKYWRFLFYSLRPTRHLLNAYLTTDDTRYRDKLIEVLDTFLEHGLDSPHIDDKHTAAFLAMVLVNTREKLLARGDLTDGMAAALLDAIHDRGRFLEADDHFELNNNHGVTQAAALMLIAHNYPQFEESTRWRDLAAERLIAVVDKNVAADGVQVEQSPFYHFYVLHFLWQLYAWNARVDAWHDPEFDAAVAGMVDFATYVTQPDGQIPLVGSSQEWPVREKFPPIFGEMAAQHPAFAYVYSAGHDGRPPNPVSRLFEPSGWAILRSGFGETVPFEAETQIHFDVGPYRTGHSHLDALSVVLFGQEQTILTDSGLFTYEEGTAHDYYWSTRAHNTVVVDRLDQLAGDVDTRELVTGDGWVWAFGTHELYPGVPHSRGTLLVGRDWLLVVDELADASADAAHTFDQTWHFAPNLDIAQSGDAVTARRAGELLAVLVQHEPGALDVSLERGQEQPRMGWSSAKYEQEVPTTAVTYRRAGSSARFVTLVVLGESTPRFLEADLNAPEPTVSFGDAGRPHVVTLGADLSLRRVVVDDVP